MQCKHGLQQPEKGIMDPDLCRKQLRERLLAPGFVPGGVRGLIAPLRAVGVPRVRTRTDQIAQRAMPMIEQQKRRHVVPIVFFVRALLRGFVQRNRRLFCSARGSNGWLVRGSVVNLEAAHPRANPGQRDM